MSKARIILEVDQLTAGYVSSMMIIEDVSISVREGEIVTILGPNGAGKSTLIRSICGLVKYTEGKVRFRSKEISGLSTHEIINQAIAYVPQTNNVFSRLSVLHNLDLGAIANPDFRKERLNRMFQLFPDLQKYQETNSNEQIVSKSPEDIVAQTRMSYVTYTKSKPELNFDHFGHGNPQKKDDLTQINGIGPYIEQRLNEIGIYNYDQISRFQEEDIMVLTELIDFFPGRIERDNWIFQAEALKTH